MTAVSNKASRVRSINAWPMNIPVELTGVGQSKVMDLSAVLCEVTLESGVSGFGFTAITEEDVVATAINNVAASSVLGKSVYSTERIWEELHWLMAPRGQSGYATHAIAAIDLALWDAKARTLDVPLSVLLGDARDEVPVYSTFGFGFYSRDELVEAARQAVDSGHRRLKMTVAGNAMLNRDAVPLSDVIREDAKRVWAVREAVGPEVELYIDANCNLDAVHATKLAHMVAEADLGFFEEPVLKNDVRHLAELRRRTGVRTAAGQNEGQEYRFRDLLVHEAVDFVQPNVTITAGITGCLKICGLASAFNVSVANGGGWPFHNMHLHAGIANGGLVEYHKPAVELCRMIFNDVPEPVNGKLQIPDRPGLGLTPDLAAVKEFSQRPSAKGRGKG